MKKIQYNGSSKILNGIVTKVNLIIDKLVVDVKVNGTSVVVVNEEGEREADIDLSLADQNVKQSPTTSSDNSDYRVLLSKSANDTEETDISRKDTNLKYNPYSGELNTSKLRAANGYFYGLSVTELQTAQYYFINGSSQVVAMLEANSASQASNPTMLYLPSTTGTLATLADIPTVVDEKVKQTPENSSSSEFEVLLSGTADNTEHTEGAKKSSKLKFVPWNSSLEVGTLSSGFYDGTVEAGTLKGYGVSGILLEAGDLSNKGTLSIYNNAGKAANVKFSNSATSDKSFEFPAVGGTIATLNDIPTITDTYDGTSSEGMSGIAVKSAIDALDVASTSIGQGETLATIKEENGRIAVTKQNIKIGLGQIDNFYRCGTNSAISGSNTWHKIASKNITATNTDAIIMLAVSDGYVPDTDADSDTNGGILYCRVRQGTPVGTFAYAKLKFVANSGLDASKFRLYYTTSSSGITFEIWTSLSRQYAWRKYNVINQSSRTSHVSNEWTLYNSLNPTSAPTESTTYVRVECEDNTYKQTDNNILGSKNLIPYPYPNGTPNITSNNVTINHDANGVLTITGSNPSSNFGYGICGKTKDTVIVLDPTQSYIMSGMSGGSGSTVSFLLDLWTENQNPETDSYTTRLYQATTETTIPSGYKYLQITLYFYTSAASLFPLTVKPMLRLATIADNTFEPYGNTNSYLSDNKIGRREQDFYGSKNLLPYPWNETTVEKNGITFTDNGDGSVTANGTASANTTFYFIVRNNARWRLEVPKGMYKLTGCPSGGSDSTYSLYFNAYRKGTSTAQSGLRDNGNGGYINYSYDAWCGGYIDIKSGTRCDNLVFKPMLRPFYSTDDEYADYAQTNRQLTISKADYRDIATVETTGKASKAYAKNELMIWRGDLHRVTQTITSGGSITLNTNVVATTLSAEIKAIRDALNI